MTLDQSTYEGTVLLWSELAIIASIIFSLLLHTKLLWSLRIPLASIETILIGASCGLLIVSGTSLWFIILICLLQSYRLFGLFRLVKNRGNTHALRNKSLRTEAFLSSGIVAVLLLRLIAENITISTAAIFVALSAVQFVAALVLLQHTIRSKSVTKALIPKKFLTDSELPSLTVAIPARNETHDLNRCMNTILQTTYPKLEILVLDDCSQDKTSDIIKKFAHRGVRFLEGKPPDSSWLAKNYAYKQLLDEADGKYILFCGTDVRFEPDSLRIIINSLIKNELEMMSILPTRTNYVSRHFLLQPMRYWRELVIPRTFNKTPPTLSTCWVARKEFLQNSGGFGAYKKTIRPEKIIARAAALSQKYAFFRSTSGMGVSSVKGMKAQWNTAVRTRYPELRNRPENVIYATMWETLILIGPIASFIYGIVAQNMFIVFLSLGSISVLLYTSALVHAMVSGKASIIRLVLFPLSVVLEIIVTNYSMWAYEFSEVIWKGRNVCLPVLQANLKLPKLED